MPLRHATASSSRSPPCFAATAALADTLIDNVNGIRSTPTAKIQRFTGVLIGDDGKVVHGCSTRRSAARRRRRIDGGGRTLLPGLIDAHGHVMGLGFGALQLDLTGTRRSPTCSSGCRAYAAANPDARWIVGRGWNQEMWPVKRFPTAADLDAVVSDRPVWLSRVDGHAVGRQPRGDEGGRRHCRDQGTSRRPDRERPVRRRRDGA